MPRRQRLPDDLTPGQVVALQDVLLAKAGYHLLAAVALRFRHELSTAL
ncbi:hypothetical protein [Cellulosimicrobium cellulans]|nr:hypothetical protein [Cellulosimicrobium cellulans]MDF9875804.1 hypothetical protein [Cellulosimicrobium cellulans]